MRKSIFGLLSILALGCQSQELEFRSVESYFDQIAQIEFNELTELGVLIDSVTIADKFKDKESGGLNQKGFEKYADVKMEVYQSFFKDYLYQQHLPYNDKVFVFNGWTFSSSPSVSLFDHPVYDIWLIKCY